MRFTERVSNVKTKKYFSAYRLGQSINKIFSISSGASTCFPHVLTQAPHPPFTILRATEYSRYICDNLLLEKLSVFQWQTTVKAQKTNPLGKYFFTAKMKYIRFTSIDNKRSFYFRI